MPKSVLIHFVDHRYIEIPFVVWQNIDHRLGEGKAQTFQVWDEGTEFRYAFNIHNITYVEPVQEPLTTETPLGEE